MQSLGGFFTDNKGLAVLAIVIAALVAIAILVVLFRLLFGRRLHMANGGRARQPRLGVVDAFDLDRQRQLVLVRRDNVEHLIMIGGPNDLLIERAIVRMQPSVAVPFSRDKDGSAAPTAPSAANQSALSGQPGSPAPASVMPPTIGTAPEPSSDRMRQSAPVGGPTPGPVGPGAQPQPVRPNPAPPRSPAPLPTRQPQQPAASPPSPGLASPPSPAAPPTRPGPTPLRAAPGTPTPRPATTPTALRPPPLTRVTSAASLRRDPVPGPPTPPDSAAPPSPQSEPAPKDVKPVEPQQPAPTSPAVEPSQNVTQTETAPTAPVVEPTNPPVAAEPPRPVPPLPTTLDTLESLEEEMAKLLGRPASDKG